MILALYVLALVLLALHAVEVVGQPGATTFLIILCLLGAWRGGAGLVHLGRALLYRRRRFPCLRAAADALGADDRAGHVYIVMTGAPGRAEITARVIQAALAEARRYGVAATLVAVSVEDADRRLIKQVFAAAAPPPDVRLAFVRHPEGPSSGQGLAAAFRAISRMIPNEDAAVVVLEWRTLLPAGVLARSLPFLRLRPEVRSLVTDRVGIVDGGPLRRSMTSLRSAERHQLMSSLALTASEMPARQPMTICRACEVVRPELIRTLEQGGVRFMPAADVLYVPDVRVVTIEDRPHEKSADRSGQADTAPRHPPGSSGSGLLPAGLAACRSLVDRLTPWTPAIGLGVAVLFSLEGSVSFLWAGLLWLGVIALVRTVVLLTARPGVDEVWPVLVLGDELFGALAKRRLRMPASHGLGGRLATSEGPLFRGCCQGLALSLLLAALAFATGVLRLPPLGALAAAF